MGMNAITIKQSNCLVTAKAGVNNLSNGDNNFNLPSGRCPLKWTAQNHTTIADTFTILINGKVNPITMPANTNDGGVILFTAI